MLLKLLGLPVTAPIAGIRYCLERIADVAEREMWDDEPVRESLMLLNADYDEGRVTEEEFRVREAELLARLREIRARRGAAPAAEEAESGGRDRHVVIEMPNELE